MALTRSKGGESQGCRKNSAADQDCLFGPPARPCRGSPEAFRQFLGHVPRRRQTSVSDKEGDDHAERNDVGLAEMLPQFIVGRVGGSTDGRSRSNRRSGSPPFPPTSGRRASCGRSSEHTIPLGQAVVDRGTCSGSPCSCDIGCGKPPAGEPARPGGAAGALSRSSAPLKATMAFAICGWWAIIRISPCSSGVPSSARVIVRSSASQASLGSLWIRAHDVVLIIRAPMLGSLDRDPASRQARPDDFRHQLRISG